MKRRAASVLTSILIAIALVGPALAQNETPPLWGELEAGTHSVGFHHLWQLDFSRIWPRSAALDSTAGNVSRPMRIDVWYPASPCEAPAPLQAYVQMEAPSESYQDLVFLTHRLDAYSYRGLAQKDSTLLRKLMNVRTAACEDAPAAPWRFPLVLYSAGWFNRAPDNTILAEYLASHGFVVATVPQLNPGLWTFNFHSDFNSVENQTRDLEFALGVLTSQPFVDRTRVAVMGYSTGGDVVLLLQERNALIDAVVGLDASWSLDPDNDVAGSPFFSAERSDIPILALRRPQTDSSRYDVVLDALKKAPRIVAEVPGADHGSFSDDPPERRYLGLDTGGHETAHAQIARATLAFLQATLLDPGSFDGTKLAKKLQALGLSAQSVPATPAGQE